jgi:glutathione S-transferase
LKPEDKTWMNSDISYINIYLKTNNWIGGDVATQADVDAYEHFKGRDIDESLHPNAKKWFGEME